MELVKAEPGLIPRTPEGVKPDELLLAFAQFIRALGEVGATWQALTEEAKRRRAES